MSRTRHRGAVMVEYALLLVAIVMPAIVALSALGVKLLDAYQYGRDTILAPFP